MKHFKISKKKKSRPLFMKEFEVISALPKPKIPLKVFFNITPIKGWGEWSWKEDGTPIIQYHQF